MFCAAILILKKEEDTQHCWHVLLYYFKKGKNATEMQKKTCAVYGEGAVPNQRCPEWFAKFLGSIDIVAKQSFAVGLP